MVVEDTVTAVPPGAATVNPPSLSEVTVVLASSDRPVAPKSAIS